MRNARIAPEVAGEEIPIANDVQEKVLTGKLMPMCTCAKVWCAVLLGPVDGHGQLIEDFRLTPWIHDHGAQIMVWSNFLE